MRLVFCLPGNSFSGRFLDCWTATVAYCLQNGIQMILSRKESCNIYYVRNMCLGADVLRGKEQKPFDGKLDYDYLMWVDCDIIWQPEQITRLLLHKRDIVSGVYLMSDGQHFAAVKDWDEEYFAKNGCFQFLSPEDLTPNPSPCGEGRPECNEGRGEVRLVEVAYTGMGFMLVKRGVFESMEYPWFRPIEKRIGNAVDFTMEDVAFCLRAQEKGYAIHVDPRVKVGHEKKMTL